MSHPVFPVRLAILLAASAFSFLTCSKDEPSGPQGIPTPFKEPDSSSHEFLWERLTFGDDHSAIYDIAVVSDSEAWFVGEITTRDSSNKLVNHNSLHYRNGEWKIVDILTPYYQGVTPYPARINAAFAFSSSDVWFYISGLVQRWNGERFLGDTRINPCLNGPVLRMWGKNSSDIWFVGRHGTLVHYDGKECRKLDAGTDFDINDVWGVGDTALCVASNWLWDFSESKILRLVNGKAEPAYMEEIPRGMTSIWFLNGMRQLSINGSFYAEWSGSRWERKPYPFLKFVGTGIRGNSPVDFFIIDQTTGVAHFNGNSWFPHFIGNVGDYHLKALACAPHHVWVAGDDKIGQMFIEHGMRK